MTRKMCSSPGRRSRIFRISRSPRNLRPENRNRGVHSYSSDVLSESDLRTVDLYVSSLLSKLMNYAGDLGGSSGSHWVSFGDESAINIDRDFSSKVGLVGLEKLSSFSRPSKSEVFVVQYLGDRERVVDLSNIYIIRFYSSHLVGRPSCVLCNFEAGQRTLSPCERHRTGSEPETRNPDRLVSYLLGHLRVGDD